MYINTHHVYSNIQQIIEDRNRICNENDNVKPLVFLVAGLAWEEKTKSKKLYIDIDNYVLPDEFWRIFEMKKSNIKAVVEADCGLKCNLLKDSPIDQMFFFMETYGEKYSFE